MQIAAEWLLSTFKVLVAKGVSGEKYIDQYLVRSNGSLGSSVGRISFELRSRANSPSRHAPKVEMGLSGTPSARNIDTSVVKPELDSFWIIIHKNAAPDSYIVQFKDEKVMAKGQNQIFRMNLAAMVVEENQLRQDEPCLQRRYTRLLG